MFDPNETKSVLEIPEEDTPNTPENPTSIGSSNDGVNWREVADNVGEILVEVAISIFT